MPTNYSFNLNRNSSKLLELSFLEHIEELRYRIFLIFSFILFLFGVIIIKIKELTIFLIKPTKNVQFFQSSPNSFFNFSMKIACYIGIYLSIPVIISQLFLFLAPGLKIKEIKKILLLWMSSFVLFGLGGGFSYYILIPSTLNFFLKYSESISEPFWSFKQYFEFISILFNITGLISQIPVLQILIELSGFQLSKYIFQTWRYFFLLSVILGAILTPTTDPITQLIFSSVIFLLYIFGSKIFLNLVFFFF